MKLLMLMGSGLNAVLLQPEQEEEGRLLATLHGNVGELSMAPTALKVVEHQSGADVRQYANMGYTNDYKQPYLLRMRPKAPAPEPVKRSDIEASYDELRNALLGLFGRISPETLEDKVQRFLQGLKEAKEMPK